MKTRRTIQSYFIEALEQSALRAALVILLSFTMTSCLTSDRTAVDTATTDCGVDLGTTGPCTVSGAGFYVTNKAGEDISSWANDTASTQVTAQITNGFYSNKIVSFTSPNLLSSNIRGGTNIFGVTGSYSTLPSMAHRTLGTTQLSSYTEITTLSGVRLPSASPYGYREVPNVSLDDDGVNGVNVTVVNRSSWSGKTCGLAGTVDYRIADCLSVLGSSATWNGSTYGNAGQSIWKIVTRTGECVNTSPTDPRCKEVWRDDRTGLLWSSRVATAIDWCKASGNNLSDPSSLCNDPLRQNVSAGVAAISACFDGGVPSSFSDTDNLSGSIINRAGKGGLTSTATATSPAVIWRLPTMHDWQVANVDGVRFVLPDIGALGTGGTIRAEWTATIKSRDRSMAWVFDFYEGGFSTAVRSQSDVVGARCVGH